MSSQTTFFDRTRPRLRTRSVPTQFQQTLRRGEIPAESLESGLDRVHNQWRTRAGMVCGVIIAALAQAAPTGGHQHLLTALEVAVLPAAAVAAIAFPLISWLERRDKARLVRREGPRRG